MKAILRTAIFLLALPVAGAAQSASSLFVPSGANFVVYRQGGANFIIHQSRLAQWGLSRSIEQIASGTRIVRASDDPSGLAVAEKMDSMITGMKQQAMNDEDMRNYIRYTESMLAQDQQILRRMQLVIQRSAGGILTPSDREINQSEIDQLLAQIEMNARFSTFNTKQVIPELTPAGLGIEGLSVVRDPYGAMKRVDAAMDRITKLRAIAGARDNRLSFKIEGQYMYMVNLQAAESRIRDADIAETIGRLVQQRTLLQTQHGLLIRSADK